MKNFKLLFKSIFRFLKRNIILSLSLMFVMFFSVLTFVSLNNSSNNLITSYNNLISKGHLHDFVINTKYNNGNAGYYTKYNEDTNTNDGGIKHVHNSESSNNSNILIFSVPFVTDLSCNIDSSDKNYIAWSGLYLKCKNDYEKNYNNDFFGIVPDYLFNKSYSRKNISIKIPYSEHDKYINNPSLILENKEYKQFINSEASTINSSYFDKLTSVVSEWASINFKNEINEKYDSNTRKFNSLNLSTSKQNTFFKIVESEWNRNPDLNIDNIVLYSGNKFSDYLEYSEYGYRFSGYLSDYSKNIIDKNLINSPELNRYQKMGFYFLKLLSRASWTDEDYELYFNSYYKFIEELKKDKNIKIYDPYLINDIEKDPNLNEIYKNVYKKVFGSDSSHKYNIKKAASNFRIIIDKNDFYDKDYVVTIKMTNNIIPVNARIENFRSYEAIVTDNYLKNNNKKIFPYDAWKDKLFTSQDEFKKWFKSIDSKYKAYIDNEEYIILGTGLSPDFMYPIVSLSNQIPNLDNEALIYVNKDGYSRIRDAFRGSETEELILGRFNNRNLSRKEKENVINEINLFSKNYMSWPENVKPAYLFDDLSNTLTPSSLRVTFVPKVISLVSTISFFLTIFISIITLLIMSIALRKFIDLNRVELGILEANGYKKRSIIFPLLTAILTIIAIGTICGYLTGFALTNVVLSLFSNFIIFKIFYAPYNFWIMLLYIFFILLFFFIVIIILSYFSLKGDAVELMSENSKYKKNFLKMGLKKVFNRFSPMTWFRISAAISSIWKLVVFTASIAILVSSITFSLSSFNKFNDAYERSFSQKKYNYAIDFYTPTDVGGQYYLVPYDHLNMTLKKGKYINYQPLNDQEINGSNPNNQNLDLINKKYLETSEYSNINRNEKNKYWYDKMIFQKYGNFHIPMLNDSTDIDTELNYLKWFSESKIILNQFIGKFGIGINPWSIADKLMPMNQNIYATNSMKLILSKMTIDDKNTYFYNSSSVAGELVSETYKDGILRNSNIVNDVTNDDPNVFLDLSDPKSNDDDPNNDVYRTVSSVGGLFLPTVNPNFINLLNSVFANPEYLNYNYMLFYNKIPFYPGNETYSYAQFNIDENKDEKNTNSSYRIVGFQEDTNFIKLTDSDGNDINDLLKDYRPINNEIPIIINHFTSKRKNLNINDEFKVTITNTIDRFTRNNSKITNKIINGVELYKNVNSSDIVSKPYKNVDNNYTFKVIGICDSYDDYQFYTNKKYVSKMVGLDQFSNKDDLSDVFNGIFSKNKNVSEITNSISFYSPSGLWISSDSYYGTNFINILESTSRFFNSNNSITNLELAKRITGISADTSTEFQNILINTYGKTSYVSIINYVEPIDVMISSFKIMNDTATKIQFMIIVIIMLVTLIVLFIMAMLLISDSIKLSGYLKVLGLKNINNSLSLLSVYFPALFVGIGISIPISLGFITAFSEIIFQFSNILLIIPLMWWDFLLASLIVILFFFVSFVIAWIRIRKCNMCQIIK